MSTAIETLSLFDQGTPTTGQPEPANVSTQPPSSRQPQVSNQPRQSLTTLSREPLLEQVLQSVCRDRRWERERFFGATDEELGRSLGNCYCFGDEVNLEFTTASEPALTITYRIFNTTLTTASFAEIAQYVRRIVGIPEAKSEPERTALLNQKLEQIRAERRDEIRSRVRSLTGEKRPAARRSRKASEPQPRSITNEIVELLFAPDCMTEASDKRLLIRLTTLFHREAKQDILKAAENAVQIIKNAKSVWSCYTAYWTDEYETPSRYQSARDSVT